MKKLILLLFIPLLFACSSDSSDGNNLRDFLTSNVFFYQENTITAYDGLVDHYVIFDFQEQPYQYLTRNFWFSGFEAPACSQNDTTLYSESYRCNVEWVLGEIVEETNNKIVWQSQNFVQLEITKINSQNILYTFIYAPPFAEPEVTGTQEFQLSSFEELEDQLENVGYTEQFCNNCTY